MRVLRRRLPLNPFTNPFFYYCQYDYPSWYFEHPLIKRQCVQQRDYQVELAKRASRSSTLLVLPTGLGKTVVAAMVIAQVLHSKGGKVLF